MKKTVLITGANSGIGKETAKALAQQGFRVLMLCRNPQKGELARQELVKETGNEEIELWVCDLGVFDDVRKTGMAIRAKYDRLDVLINNAGIVLANRELNADGIELTFAVSHLGHFILTHYMMDLLKAAEAARVIHVSSTLHHRGKIDWDDINYDKSYYQLVSYARAKLANVLFSNELARKLEGTKINSNSLHPGGVATNIAEESDWMGRLIYKYFGWAMRTPAEGADTSIYLATDPKAAQYTGKYFDRRKVVAQSKLAQDESLAKELWQRSLAWTGIEEFGKL